MNDNGQSKGRTNKKKIQRQNSPRLFRPNIKQINCRQGICHLFLYRQAFSSRANFILFSEKKIFTKHVHVYTLMNIKTSKTRSSDLFKIDSFVSVHYGVLFKRPTIQHREQHPVVYKYDLSSGCLNPGSFLLFTFWYKIV